MDSDSEDESLETLSTFSLAARRLKQTESLSPTLERHVKLAQDYLRFSVFFSHEEDAEEDVVGTIALTVVRYVEDLEARLGLRDEHGDLLDFHIVAERLKRLMEDSNPFYPGGYVELAGQSLRRALELWESKSKDRQDERKTTLGSGPVSRKLEDDRALDADKVVIAGKLSLASPQMTNLVASRGPLSLFSIVEISDKALLENVISTVDFPEGFLNVKNNLGCPLLNYAARRGDEEIVHILLEHNAEPNCTDSSHQTPLQIAVVEGCETIALDLLKHAASPYITPPQGGGLLHLAIDRESTEMTQCLLLHTPGLCDSSDEFGRRALHQCAQHSFNEAMLRHAEIILQHGADVDCVDHQALTPLHMAVRGPWTPLRERMVDLLLRYNAQVDLDDLPSRWRDYDCLRQYANLNQSRALPTRSGRPPETLPEALSARNTSLIREMVIEDLETHAKGDYLWLQDLIDTGFTRNEVADILVEELTDAPWIQYKLPDPPASRFIHGKHLDQCAHSLRVPQNHGSEPFIEYRKSLGLASSKSMQRIVQEYCGLGGVRPSSNNRKLFGGTVDFDRSLATVSYASSETSATEKRRNILGRLISALDQFLDAASATQAAGQCCDSFTILGISWNEHPSLEVEMRRVQFSLVSTLSANLQRLSDFPSSITTDVERFAIECIRATVDELLCCLLPVHVLPKGVTLDDLLHNCALAVQALCIGLISYSQAHIYPLEIFFLDRILTEVKLIGTAPSEHAPAIYAFPVQLSCFGGLTENPVMVFADATWRGFMKLGLGRYDIRASAEDILDTFGPGKFVFAAPGAQEPCAVFVRGGLIAASVDQPWKFHWDRKSQLKRDLSPFDPGDKLLIGALWNLNISCTFDAERCRNRVCLEPLGTAPEIWDACEQQGGLQLGGPYCAGTYNRTYCKIAGTTLKSRILGSTDDMLLLDLEDCWGVKVSACTAVACRVPLRLLLADVLPIFAEADARTRGQWETLQIRHDVINGLKQPNFIEFVAGLDQEAQNYLLAKIRGILEVLQYTGVSKSRKYLSVAWPHGKDLQRGIRITCEKESYWTRMLTDTSDCATFAYMSSQCLESGHCRCSGSQVTWGNSAKLLITAVSLHQHMKASRLTTVNTAPVSTWMLCHNERYLIGTEDAFLKVHVVKPPSSEYALLRPSMVEIPWKYGRRITEKMAEKAGNVARLRERQNAEDEAENVLVTCHF